MNKDIEVKALEIHQWLLKQDVVQEYLKYEKSIKENKELSFQESRLKQLQKEIVNKKYHDDDCSQIIDEYENLKKEFYEHPLVHNYLLLKEEVNQLFQEITHIINQNINKDT